MKTRIFVAFVVAFVIACTVPAVFAAPKAEIWQDKADCRGEYYLVDPVTREKLTLGYGYITTDEKGNFVGHGHGYKEVLDSYTDEPVRRFYQKIFKKDGMLIGELGACQYILNSKTGERMSSGYHSVYHGEKGLLFGELCAMKYILNPETKRRLSKGYHEIYFDNQGRLIAELGARKYQLDPITGEQIAEPK